MATNMEGVESSLPPTPEAPPTTSATQVPHTQQALPQVPGTAPVNMTAAQTLAAAANIPASILVQMGAPASVLQTPLSAAAAALSMLQAGPSAYRPITLPEVSHEHPVQSPTPSSPTTDIVSPNGDQGEGSASARRVTAKRAEQNRAAQRAFRERKQRYIKELEVKSSLLETRNAQLADSEARHRELTARAEGLKREREVWMKERELWWREREEIFRIVDTLRRELEGLQAENEKLRDVVFGLWQESRNGTKPGDASNQEKKDGTSTTQKDGGPTGTEGGKESQSDAMETDGTVDASASLAAGTDKTAGREGSGAGATTALDGTIKKAGPPINLQPPDAAPQQSPLVAEALHLDLKSRIQFWDTEREGLYRAQAAARAFNPLAALAAPGQFPSGPNSRPVSPAPGGASGLATPQRNNGTATPTQAQQPPTIDSLQLAAAAAAAAAAGRPRTDQNFLESFFNSLVAQQLAATMPGGNQVSPQGLANALRGFQPGSFVVPGGSPSQGVSPAQTPTQQQRALPAASAFGASVPNPLVVGGAVGEGGVVGGVAGEK
ncbi:hypothetical protein HDV00_008343 [Rhizophlyctis rosea]|nr:hypothetical protein HDV00_008343 [Rhizophlyctis rosea]